MQQRTAAKTGQLAPSGSYRGHASKTILRRPAREQDFSQRTRIVLALPGLSRQRLSVWGRGWCPNVQKGRPGCSVPTLAKLTACLEVRGFYRWRTAKSRQNHQTIALTAPRVAIDRSCRSPRPAWLFVTALDCPIRCRDSRDQACVKAAKPRNAPSAGESQRRIDSGLRRHRRLARPGRSPSAQPVAQSPELLHPLKSRRFQLEGQ